MLAAADGIKKSVGWVAYPFDGCTVSVLVATIAFPDVLVAVAVMVALAIIEFPPTAVTKPFWSTVAMEGSLENQCTDVDPVRFCVVPPPARFPNARN